MWHIPLGPMLWKDDYNLYLPGDPETQVVPNYYESEYKHKDSEDDLSDQGKNMEKSSNDDQSRECAKDIQDSMAEPRKGSTNTDGIQKLDESVQVARQNDLKNIDSLPWAHPQRIFATLRFALFHGITRDIIGHQNKGLDHVHSRAPHFDNKVEHLWTTAQVCSAMIMSVAHGANDVSNAIGPFTTEYETWRTGDASSETGTPIWIKAVGGLGLGVGFWTFG